MPGENININLPESLGETTKEFYDDALHPVMKSTGQTASLVPRAIKAALLPIEKWILHRETELEKHQKLLSQKLASCNPDAIVPPHPYIAVPALIAMSYSQDNHTLRNMYANLLARAMLIETKDDIHPAYVEIIKQMSPIDAKFFKTAYESKNRPVLQLMAVTKKETTVMKLSLGSSVHASTYFITKWEEYPYEHQNLSMSNLVRLGLFDPIGETSPYTNDTVYDQVRNTKTYLSIKKELLKDYSNFALEEKKHAVETTPLGIFFYNYCVHDVDDIFSQTE